MDERELARKAEIAELLLEAARYLGDTLEPEPVYERFRELLGNVVPHDGIVVSSYSEEDDLIRCDYAWVEGNVIDATALPPLPLDRKGGGMQSQVIATGRAALYNDVSERVEQRRGTFYNVDREGTVKKIPDSGPAGTSAAMMVPVKHEGRVVGVVQVMRDAGGYSEEQLELVEGLVAQMAAAVRNARLQQERRRLEAAEAAARAVAAERAQAARVLEAVGEGIFFVDDDGLIRLWNRTAERVTGLDAEAMRGRLADALPGWESIVTLVPVAESGETPRPVTLPLDLGGQDLWLSFVAVRSGDGVVYAFRDVTFERRLEEDKSDFVATVSHQLRTPLAAVYGAAATLLREDVDPAGPSGRELLEVIASQTARLAQIVEQVLLTNELDRGELRLEQRPVDVVELVRETVRAMEGRLPPVVLDVAEHARAAAGDADRIHQVLANLLDNAAKYGGGGEVTVRVADANGDVVISVGDSGPGIPPPEQQRIFEKFYRGDPQLTRTPGGSGLGLYISRELARRMGGRLDVSSSPGAGATFVLQLPRA